MLTYLLYVSAVLIMLLSLVCIAFTDSLIFYFSFLLGFLGVALNLDALESR
jgi:hypothetical protein